SVAIAIAGNLGPSSRGAGGSLVRALFTLIALVLTTTSALGQTTADRHFSGTIEPRTPRASFELELEAGQVVTLTTASAKNFDTVLTLNGPNGRQVAQNDDQQPGVLTSRIIYMAPTSGRYTAIVTGFNGASGVFELNVSYRLDVGLSDAARILREQRLSFERGHAELRFPVDLNANDIFVATTVALTDRLDTTLKLVGPHGV